MSTKCYVILWCDILIDIAETDISVDKILFTGMEHTPFAITVGSYMVSICAGTQIVPNKYIILNSSRHGKVKKVTFYSKIFPYSPCFSSMETLFTQLKLS